MTTASAALAEKITTNEQEAYQIAIEAYFYFYPLLSMEVTRRQCINLESGKKPGFGPSNSFAHIRQYPDADFRTVVRPNFDTLYSSAWLDISEEPQIITIPDANDRYYLLPMLDMWTDVFASPGWRTSGTAKQAYAVALPTWKGSVPDGVERLNASTAWVWVIGRTKTDGPDDYAAVHKFQDGMSIVPLSQWGNGLTPKVQAFDSSVDMKTPPLEQINAMPAAEYFKLAAQLLKHYPSHNTDWSVISRLSRIGIIAGEEFDAAHLPANVQKSLDKAAVDALKLLRENTKSVGRPINGWIVNTDSIGVYGNSYMKRAIISMVGLGANQPDDAVYPLNIADSDGQPLIGTNNYILHFDKENIPPVSAFWSLTMYDKDGFQAANSINRFAISSWMPLKMNSDGSLDLYIQNENPGPEREANWLPAPKDKLGVTLRLYAPKLEVLNGSWNPPAIKKV